MACPICNDSGWKPLEIDGVRRVARCDCWLQKRNENLLKDANIKARYEHCSFENFVTYDNDSLQDALRAARRFALDYSSKKAKAPFFIGPPGVGKTHLATALLRQLIREWGARGLFYETSKLLQTIRSTYNADTRASESAILRPLMTVDILVLDDIGRERVTDWVDEMMNLIVNTRYSEQLPTIFTSNYEESPDFEDPNTLGCRIGRRILSRLHEMCEFVEMKAGDFRLKQPHDGEAELKRNEAEQRMQPKFRPGVDGKQLKAKLRTSQRQGKLDLNWPGGKAGNS